ncbi:HAD-IIB family hydrolase [Hansschlegelia plantiphila]|uniref:Haloacid dehalogenase n=1 Tax=Hansschlegelia plantiphila TaxID=374655 RepID=A0A9W6J1T6_9HYPH|nr:HAD-IIB family hydrolase [Hansschlegelia plantiphila]GLK69271.1 haloacid dehalogenase [Hansschlegelia plantiphila]
MKPLNQAAISGFRDVRFVLTDMDETLTFRGRLAANTYAALEALQTAGVKVIPVTAAPAGWCDQMARMWPVDGVIGENGGLFFRRAPDGHGVQRHFWHEHDERTAMSSCLLHIGDRVRNEVPSAIFADDQPFRLTSIAFAKPDEASDCIAIVDALRKAGADVTVNNLWVLGWLGGYDKLSMTRRVLRDHYDVDVDCDRGVVLYSGDSTNDAPMFSFFEHTVGVSTIKEYLDQIPLPPRWITRGPGGAGFVEVAKAVISARNL